MNAPIKAEEHRVRQIRKLTEVSRALTYATTVEDVFQLTVARAADLLAAEKSLLLVTRDDGLLAVRAARGVDSAAADRFQEPLTEKLVPHLAGLIGASPECFLGVPLVVAGAIKGILVVIRAEPSTETEQDEWLLSALADQAAAALERSRLGEIGEFREQLIGIIGHDLRNPLSTIEMGAHLLLQRTGLGEVETEVARKIARSAAIAARLIDQLLDLTRSRLGGGITIDQKRFDMMDVCRQVIGEAELAHPDRPLRVAARGDLIGMWDRDRMYQVPSNLVGNAVQHGEPRSTIDLRIDGGETQVLIEVVSRGEPIPPEMLPFIFDAFRKGRTVHQAQPQGLGLGLFIAQEIARAHGGSIAATSSENEGTTFSVRLPRDAAARAAEGTSPTG
ncbi:MAG TPA: HAMP domain-containing sensor histidine kinase [Tepidiformaceae bacterium]|nr:HAMP domain-containing sensor histidine kinase [Tepidiformaceae bacterium]